MSGGPVIQFNFGDDNRQTTPMDCSDDEDHAPRETSKFMTNFEFTRCLGARAELLSQGAQPLVPTEGQKDLLKIAEKELYAGVLPIIIVRPLPGGKTEEWCVQDLILPSQ
jgi:DNA-directed RNA polymerase subunit K/omega